MGSLTHWRGQPDTGDRRRLGWVVVVSLLLHTPLTPLIGLLGLVSFLSLRKPEPVPEEPLTTIPVDLLDGDEPGAAAPPPPAPVVAAPPEGVVEPSAPPKPKPKPKPKQPIEDAGIVDAEAPDAATRDAEAPDAALDAGLPDAAATPSDAGSDAASDAGIADADAGTPNPMAALAGDAKKVVDPNANVQLIIYPEKIRNHPLAPRIGQLLASVYQWRDFFGPAKLDPIRDVDRILIVGPELRDSSNVAAIIQHNVGQARMHEALDAIVHADPEHGEWLDAGVPAATAYADRAPRVLVMPSPKVVVVVPPNLKEAALGVALPHGIAWAKVWITPSDGGGAVVEAEAEDESPEAATKDAAALNAQIQDALSMAASVSLLGQMFLGTRATRWVENIELHADGNKIRGTATLTEEQIERLLEMVRGSLVERRSAPSRRDAGTP